MELEKIVKKTTREYEKYIEKEMKFCKAQGYRYLYQVNSPFGLINPQQDVATISINFYFSNDMLPIENCTVFDLGE